MTVELLNHRDLLNEHQQYLIECDDSGAVDAINTGKSGSPATRETLEMIEETEMESGVKFLAAHILGIKNTIADVLSRVDTAKAKLLAKRLPSQGTIIVLPDKLGD